MYWRDMGWKKSKNQRTEEPKESRFQFSGLPRSAAGGGLNTFPARNVSCPPDQLRGNGLHRDGEKRPAAGPMENVAALIQPEIPCRRCEKASVSRENDERGDDGEGFRGNQTGD